MSDGAVLAVIVGAVVLALIIVAAVVLSARARRRRRLRERFGPEYDRTVEAAGSQREAEQELAQREERHAELDIRELPPGERDRYARDWRQVQERFVDTPDTAVGEASRLVTALMADRGYPTEGYEQQAAHLSVEHASTLNHYREAHVIVARHGAQGASTEDLRVAMVHYRAIFQDLLGTEVGRPGTPESADGRALPDGQAESERRQEAADAERRAEAERQHDPDWQADAERRAEAERQADTDGPADAARRAEADDTRAEAERPARHRKR
jgi:hypothetical protein